MLPPVHTREMEWLVAFVGVVEWMEDTYPDLATSEDDGGETEEPGEEV